MLWSEKATHELPVNQSSELAEPGSHTVMVSELNADPDDTATS